MSRGDHVDGGLARHVADDSFDSWFAARMNRNRNEERRVSVGGNVSLSDDKPGKESSEIYGWNATNQFKRTLFMAVR